MGSWRVVPSRSPPQTLRSPGDTGRWRRCLLLEVRAWGRGGAADGLSGCPAPRTRPPRPHPLGPGAALTSDQAGDQTGDQAGDQTGDQAGDQAGEGGLAGAAPSHRRRRRPRGRPRPCPHRTPGRPTRPVRTRGEPVGRGQGSQGASDRSWRTLARKVRRGDQGQAELPGRAPSPSGTGRRWCRCSTGPPSRRSAGT